MLDEINYTNVHFISVCGNTLTLSILENKAIWGQREQHEKDVRITRTWCTQGKFRVTVTEGQRGGIKGRLRSETRLDKYAGPVIGSTNDMLSCLNFKIKE